jgi:hypothetical protein
MTIPETAADPLKVLEEIRRRTKWITSATETALPGMNATESARDVPRLLAIPEALLKLHRPVPNYGLAFSPSIGTPLCGHDPDTDHDSHFEGDDGEWYCRDKITGQRCSSCADEDNADLWAEWPCATYTVIAAALSGEEVPSP